MHPRIAYSRLAKLRHIFAWAMNRYAGGYEMDGCVGSIWDEVRGGAYDSKTSNNSLQNGVLASVIGRRPLSNAIFDAVSAVRKILYAPQSSVYLSGRRCMFQP
jgi:hypothetical protein